jgi:hypothetical protein
MILVERLHNVGDGPSHPTPLIHNFLLMSGVPLHMVESSSLSKYTLSHSPKNPRTSLTVFKGGQLRILAILSSSDTRPSGVHF